MIPDTPPVRSANTVGLVQKWVLVAATVSGLCVVPQAAAGSTLDWGACPFPSKAECTTVKVPLDYENADAGSIDMVVSRVRSTNPPARRGVLIVNQGGPAPHAGDTFDIAPRSLTDAYDIISFDQRGFGRSAPVRCQVPASRDTLIPWPQPGGFAEDVSVAMQIARNCVEQGGPVIAHMGTAYVARDMEVLRKALGERKISYLGMSYGSYLGTAYASLFPEHTDRALLVSVSSPDRMWRGHWQRSLGEGFALRFPDFARHVGQPVDEVYTRLVTLAKQLDRAPLQTPKGVLDGNVLRSAIYAAMYNDGQFPMLASLERAVIVGDAATAGEMALGLGAWRPSDRAGAMLGVSCSDGDWPRSMSVYQREARADAVRYPLFAGAGSNVWPCAFWPYPVDERVRANPRGPQNILIINNVRDPSTPLANAQELRAAFGDRARLVTVEQGGHNAYLYSPNVCANDAGTAFLLGTAAHDKNCA
jgi:pimeloyl-ACP methyl ester carboxylesterase